jgi:hypothetical protein
LEARFTQSRAERRNSKFEYRNSKQIQMFKILNSKRITVLNFEIRILILFRISDFVLRIFVLRTVLASLGSSTLKWLHSDLPKCHPYATNVKSNNALNILRSVISSFRVKVTEY